MKKISIEEFEEIYDPIIANKEEELYMIDNLEDYFSKEEIVLACEEKRVWTEVDEDGEFYIVSGKRFVNRMRYAITKVPYQEDIEVQYD